MSRIILYTLYTVIITVIGIIGTMCYAYVQQKNAKKYGLTGGIIIAIAVLISVYYVNAVSSLVSPWKEILYAVSLAVDGLIIAEIITSVFFIILAIMYWLKRRQAKKDMVEGSMSRRTFLKTAATIVPVATGATGVVSAFSGNEAVELNRIELKLKQVPSYLKNYKIAQITDIHIGPYISVEDFVSMVRRLAEEKPNRLVITGDIIDDLNFLDELVASIDSLVKLFPDGIDYILGNHEYIHDVNRVWKALSTTKMHMYRNSNRQLVGGTEPVYMVGVDYNFKEASEYNHVFLDKAMKGVPKDAFVILLAHHPSFLVNAFDKGIPVTLSGHTHGGQINVFGIPLIPVYHPYWRGLYTDGNGHYGYVGNGSGHWFPVRFNCPREITIFTFAKA